MISKGIGVFIAGRIMKLPFRQSLSFAILMSAKGLIALVMFNIALDAQIITNTLFTMLVAYVLFSCFMYKFFFFIYFNFLKYYATSSFINESEKNIEYFKNENNI